MRKRSAGQPGIETVAEYAKRWLADREGRISAVRDDRTRITLHVLPLLGPLDVGTFTRDDVERLRDALDTKITVGDLSWKTVACVWTLVTSMCADMVTAKKRELRTRDDNPCRDVKPPLWSDCKSGRTPMPSLSRRVAWRVGRRRQRRLGSCSQRRGCSHPWPREAGCDPMTIRAARKTVSGSDEWAADNLEYTRSLLRVVRGDAQTIAEQLGSYREYAQRHGVDFETFARDEFGGATPELLAAVESVASLGKRPRVR